MAQEKSLKEVATAVVKTLGKDSSPKAAMEKFTADHKKHEWTENSVKAAISAARRDLGFAKAVKRQKPSRGQGVGSSPGRRSGRNINDGVGNVPAAVRAARSLIAMCLGSKDAAKELIDLL